MADRLLLCNFVQYIIPTQYTFEPRSTLHCTPQQTVPVREVSPGPVLPALSFIVAWDMGSLPGNFNSEIDTCNVGDDDYLP